MNVPQWIQHRVNRLDQVRALRAGLGAEIDLRSDVNTPGLIHLSHDPFVRGDALSDWLSVWAAKPRGPLILNTKEDGLEARAFELLRTHQITSFFFLDTQIPTLVRLSREGLGRHLALRLSEFESAESLGVWRALPAGQRPGVLWVDCFGAKPLPPAILAPLARVFSPCLVSPELQGQRPPNLAAFAALTAHCQMVCTKQVDDWAALCANMP